MVGNEAELARLGFEEVGAFERRGDDLSLRLPKFRDEIGCYAFVVGDNARYVGVTNRSLSSRMNGYKNPGPTQQTNLRINPKIRSARTVRIFFLPESVIADFGLTLRRGNVERSIATDLSLFERVLISLLRPDWNRG